MDFNSKLSQGEEKLLSKILLLQGKHIFTKTLGHGEITRVTRKNDQSGVNVYFYSNIHEALKLDGEKFLEEIRNVQ